jgi:hypothetical protein
VYVGSLTPASWKLAFDKSGEQRHRLGSLDGAQVEFLRGPIRLVQNGALASGDGACSTIRTRAIYQVLERAGTGELIACADSGQTDVGGGTAVGGGPGRAADGGRASARSRAACSVSRWRRS